jgi:hypothetical protein
MNDDILFYESQPFWRNWIAILSVISVNLLFVWGLIQQVILGISWGNNPMNNLGLIIATSCMFLLTGFLFFRLQTFITEEGIYVRYSPFDFKTRFYSWKIIEKAYIRKYSPIRVGGWGIKFHLTMPHQEKAYNVFGNIGLQLLLNNGKKVLIGTNKAAELEEVLKKLNDKREQK